MARMTTSAVGHADASQTLPAFCLSTVVLGLKRENNRKICSHLGSCRHTLTLARFQRFDAYAPQPSKTLVVSVSRRAVAFTGAFVLGLSIIFAKPSTEANAQIPTGSTSSYEYNANTPDALGVVDDLFADCPASAACVSSQDDRPAHFRPPWEYSQSPQLAFNALLSSLRARNAQILQPPPPPTLPSQTERGQNERYIHAILGRNAIFTDHVEFYFTPNDTLVQFRAFRTRSEAGAAKRAGTQGAQGGLFQLATAFDLGGSQDRALEALRKDCGWSEVPVLRNRRRVFVLFESPWDSFGPATDKNIDVIQSFQRESREHGPRGAVDRAHNADYHGKFDVDPLAPAVQPLKLKSQ